MQEQGIHHYTHGLAGMLAVEMCEVEPQRVPQRLAEWREAFSCLHQKPLFYVRQNCCRHRTCIPCLNAPDLCHCFCCLHCGQIALPQTLAVATHDYCGGIPWTPTALHCDRQSRKT